MQARRATLFWLAAALLIAVGLAPGPASLWALINAPPEDSNIKWLIVALALSPYLPLVIVLLSLRSRPIIRPLLAALLDYIAFFVGLFFTLAAAAFTGAGALIILMYGMALTIAVSTTMRVLAWHALTRRHRASLMIDMTFPVLAAIWSLAAIPIISLSARSIAAGAPYCITSHFRPQTVTSLSGLRGFFFYTTASGGSDDSRDYFHGLLIVQSPDGPKVYNWSPRRLRFDLITRPHNMAVIIPNTCPPA